MTHKRAIILSEDEQIIFRHDTNNGNKFLEKDILDFIMRLDATKNILDSKKLLKMLNEYHEIHKIGFDELFMLRK